MQQHGIIPESIYKELGYHPNFEEGEIGVDRHVGIEKEHMQWAKHLIHPEQMKLKNMYKSAHKEKKSVGKICKEGEKNKESYI
eukprot:11047928-Ditylum_brightwellii.AAC.1